MKKIIVTLFLALLVGIVGVFIYITINGESIIAKYKPDLERVASENIGAKVTLGRLSLSVLPQLKVKVEEFALAEAESQSGISFKDFFLNLSVVQLLSGRVHITTLEIVDPKILLIKEGDEIRVLGLPKRAKETPANQSQSAPKKSLDESTPGSPLEIAIDSIKIKNTQVIIKDGASETKPDFATFNIGDIHLALASKKLADLDLSATIKDGNVTLSALKFPIQGIRGVFKINGNLEDINISGDKIALNLGQTPIHASVSAKKTGSVFDLNKAILEGFSGSVNLDARTDSNSNELKLNLGVKDIDLAEVLATLNPGQKEVFSGKLSGFTLALNGVLGENLLNSLKGNGEIALADGKMAGSNLAGDVLNSISNLPFLSGSLFSNLPESERNKFAEKDTELKEASSKFSIANSRVNIHNLNVLSSFFNLSATGSAGFDSSVDLKSRILFNPALSTSIVAKVKELSPTLDQDGRMVIPLTIKGKAPVFVITPDIKDLMKSGLKGAASKALGEALQDGKLDTKGFGKMLGF